MFGISRNKEGSMSGLIVIDKPKGYTSRDVVNVVSHELCEKKVGHTGTLDPLATGVLVVCVGKYTKLVDLLTSLDKEYIAEIKLGIQTDTLDITGTILKKEKFAVTKQEILKVFSNFPREYFMEVPKYSAIKVNGKKLYEYAREGIDVKLPVKKVHVYELELLSFRKDTITFRTRVEKGTYIRSLIRDITKSLGTVGTMSSLIRTRQGNFKLENAYSLDDIKNKQYQLLHIKDVLDIPIYSLNEEEFKKVSNGNFIGMEEESDFVLLTYQDREIAIYKRCEKLYKPYIMLI